jgi:hypothetical protein
MSVETRRDPAPDKATRTRCASCKCFTRLLSDQTERNRCAGILTPDSGDSGGR